MCQFLLSEFVHNDVWNDCNGYALTLSGVAGDWSCPMNYYRAALRYATPEGRLLYFSYCISHCLISADCLSASYSPCIKDV